MLSRPLDRDIHEFHFLGVFLEVSGPTVRARGRVRTKTEILEYLDPEAELSKNSREQKCSPRLGEHFWSAENFANSASRPRYSAISLFGACFALTSALFFGSRKNGLKMTEITAYLDLEAELSKKFVDKNVPLC